MYRVIGADQKEYGPVSAEQLRQWVAEGRANAQTMVQPEGGTEWKPLSSLPEFASLFAAKPPPVDSISPIANPEAFAQEILARDYNVDMGDALSRSWNLLKNDFWPIIGVSALIWIIIGAAGAAYVGILVSGPLLGGLFRFYLKKMRGEPAELGDAFSGFTLSFLQLFLGYLVSTLLTGVGFVCLILPGIYLIVAWQFTLQLIVDKKIEFWPAMEVSRKVVSEHWWSFFGFLIVTALINLGGMLALCVGVFVTLPLTMIAALYIYEDIFGVRKTSEPI